MGRFARPMDSPAAEIESIRTVVAKYFTVYGVVVTPLALTFQVTSPTGSIDAPFDGLRQELVPKDYIPTITQERGETLVHVQRRPRMRFARRQVNLLLLLLTVPSIVFFGGAWNWSGYSGEPLLSAASIGCRRSALSARSSACATQFRIGGPSLTSASLGRSSASRSRSP